MTTMCGACDVGCLSGTCDTVVLGWGLHRTHVFSNDVLSFGIVRVLVCVGVWVHQHGCSYSGNTIGVCGVQRDKHRCHKHAFLARPAHARACVRHRTAV